MKKLVLHFVCCVACWTFSILSGATLLPAWGLTGSLIVASFLTFKDENRDGEDHLRFGSHAEGHAPGTPPPTSSPDVLDPERLLKPGLFRADEDDRWQEDGIGQSFGIDGATRWVVHYEVSLFDKLIAAEIAKSHVMKFKSHLPMLFSLDFNKGGEFGELFGFTVCSSAFRDNPTDDYPTEVVARAHIQERFDEAMALSYLRSRLDAIGTTQVDRVGDEFRTFLDTEEWDYC